MKNILKLCLLLIAVGWVNIGFGQTIRKNYNEMTPSEKIAYKSALGSIQTTMQQLGCLHSNHFTGGGIPVHTPELFLPWHRWFMYQYESLLKSATTTNAQYLASPYWDWRDEYNLSQISWQNNDLLGTFNTSWNLNRNLVLNDQVAYGPGNSVQINSYLAKGGGTNPLYQAFATDMSNIHGSAHVFVGGVMGRGFSPYDPVFFMHHTFIDKLWDDWEETRINSSQPKSVINATKYYDHIHALVTCEAVTGPVPTPYAQVPHSFDVLETANPSNAIDIRKQNYINTDLYESRYAYKGKLIIDGLSGDFIVSGVKNYSYVTWDASTSKVKGSIHVGDLKRDATNNIIPDNKGGFIASSTSNIEIHTGESITFYPGFSTQIGAVLTATIIDKPFGFTSNTSLRKDNSLSLKNESPTTLHPFPNPISEGILNFGKVAESYTLYNSQGVLISQGQNTDGVNVDNLESGIYLIKVDGVMSKISVE